MASHVLGIDLGTTNSVVAYADETRVRVLRDDDGRLLTPSIVAFPESGEVKVGHAARELRLRDPQNTIYSVKRLIGRPFDTPIVAEAAERMPFALDKGPTGGVVVRVRGETLSLPEISSFILQRLRGIAQRALSAPCTHAVITVPANFNELQRTATRAAAHIAGLAVLRILNEPTAAALAYGYRARQPQRIAVYDFGGGTFDISILELSGEVIEVVSTAGDTSLGGDDIDRAVADRMADAYAHAYGVTLAPAQQTYARVMMSAESIKAQLSKQDTAQATIRRLAGTDGHRRDFSFRMEQPEFQALADPLIDRTFTICEEALRLASLRPTQLDAVLLVGGQTRTPRVRMKVGAFFGMEPQYGIDPDLAVAQGAAIQGFALAGAADPQSSFDEEPTRVRRSPDSDGFDDEPTEVSRRPPEILDSRLPSIRPDRPGTGLSQTLSGFGAQRDQGGPDNQTPPHIQTAAGGDVARAGDVAEDRAGVEAGSAAATVSAEQPAAGDPFKTRPSRPGARGARLVSVPPAAAARPSSSRQRQSVPVRAPAPAAADAALSHDDDLDVPAALCTPPAASSEAAPATLLETPRAKAKAAAAAAMPSSPPSPQQPSLSQARALAAQGHTDAALLVYGELLLRDPNDPRLLQEARELRTRHASGEGASVQPPDTAGPLRAVEPRGLDQELHDLTAALVEPVGASEPSRSLAAPPAAPAASDHGALAEDVSALLSPLPPQLRSTRAGAASQLPGPRSQAPLLLDVTPHTLNVETVDGFCEALIERNAPIPTEQTRIFTTSSDQQQTVSVRVSQGESRRTEDNHVLGQIDLVDLRRASRGEVQIAVTFVIDADGTLSARAVDEGTGRSQELRVRLTGAIEPAEIERMRASGRLRTH